MDEKTTISIEKATSDKLDLICKVLGKDKYVFLREFIDAFAQITASYEVGNIEYEISILGESFTVYFSGSRNLIVGKARTDEEVSEKIGEDRLKREARKRFG